MNIYEPLVKENHEWVSFLDLSDYDKISSITDERSIMNVSFSKLHLISDKDGEKCFFSDFPWLSSQFLVFRNRPKKLFSQFLNKNGFFISLETDIEEKLDVFVAEVADALNEEKSQILYFKDSKRIMKVIKYSFVEDKLKDKMAFRLAFKGSPIFVTQEFVDLYNKNNLAGLEFKKRN